MRGKYILPAILAFAPLVLLFSAFLNQPAAKSKISFSPAVPAENMRASLKLEAAPKPEIKNQVKTPNQKNTTSQFTYTVKTGDTLSSLWSEFDSDNQRMLAAQKSLKDADVKLSTFLQTGNNLILKTKDSAIIFLRRKMSDGKKVILKLNQKINDYEVKITEPEILSNEKSVAGIIEGSLAQTADKMGIPYDLVDEMVDIFGGKIAFTKDIHPGDSFSVIYEARTLRNGKEITPGKIFAASIISKGKFHAAVAQIDSDGKRHFVDEKGEVQGDYFLRYPVKFTRISSVFSGNRFHPVLKRSRPHNGVDFAAPTGTPIRAVADGSIVAASYSRGNGNWIKIQHTKRYATAYLHLSKIAKGIRTGVKVERGQYIGNVGMTGLASGPHLHYSFYDSGKYVDPLKIKLPTLNQDKVKINQEEFKAYLTLLKDSHAKFS